jgi:excisionase family DNA binding protein
MATETTNQHWTERATLSVPEAGRLLGIGTTASYAAARRGDLPTLRIGGRLLVPVSALRRLLEVDTRAGAS